MKKLQILVVAHKEDSHTRNESPYTAIQVGCSLRPDLNLGYLKDNVGDNISEKNANWSEFTALYWAWKNIKNVEYLGICHYRRYFDIPINENNIEKYLNGKDMIVVKSPKMLSRMERANNLMHMTSQEDFYVFADVFLGMYPHFRQQFVKYFYNSKDSFPYSMLIAKKELFDKYCDFIFPVLFEVEKKIRSHGYTRLKRTMGYFGEWSLGLFVYCYSLSVSPQPLLFFGEYNKHSKIAVLFKSCWKWVYGVVELFKPAPNDVYVPADVRAGLKQDGLELHNLK